jgi:hypothetical protein
VQAEFVLTGLSNKDGNRANHEIGICLPQFTLNVTSNCLLTIKPKYAVGAYVSLLVTGKDASGASNVPVASDGAAAIADAVNNRVGYYYLDPLKCPQQYSMRIKGAALLSSGAWLWVLVLGAGGLARRHKPTVWQHCLSC